MASDNNLYHVSLETGNTEVCHARVKPCPYGDIGFHSVSPEQARLSYERRMEKFHAWERKSNVPKPLNDPWTTQHVFDPDDPRTYSGFAVFLGGASKMNPIPMGTRLVIENGWIFEKHFGRFWMVVDGEGYDALGISKDVPTRHYQILSVIETYGARLEFGGPKNIRPTRQSSQHGMSTYC